jgi:hypothetical protein
MSGNYFKEFTRIRIVIPVAIPTENPVMKLFIG